MALTDSGLKALLPKEKKYRVSVGDALYVLVYPNGGKYFVWKYRFPPNRSGQFRDYQIGPYGKGPGKWTLKQAKDEVIRLDQLRKAGEDPRLLKSESKKQLIKQATTPSLLKAVGGGWSDLRTNPVEVNTYSDPSERNVRDMRQWNPLVGKRFFGCFFIRSCMEGSLLLALS